MKKKNEIERKCLCGRIITDPNNKTGLCPSCQKTGNTIVGGVGLATIGVGVKKFGPKAIRTVGEYGPKVLKAVISIVKK